MEGKERRERERRVGWGGWEGEEGREKGIQKYSKPFSVHLAKMMEKP